MTPLGAGTPQPRLGTTWDVLRRPTRPLGSLAAASPSAHPGEANQPGRDVSRAFWDVLKRPKRPLISSDTASKLVAIANSKPKPTGKPTRDQWIDYLPPLFRTRRGFAALLGGVAFVGFSGYYLAKGDGPLAVLGGLGSGFTVFFFCWFVFRGMTGFDP
jgi:hypothetical protein